MIAESIRELLDREPFVPFRLIASSGQSYDVVDAHSAALLKSEVFVVLPDGERWAHMPYLHIATVETIGNGHQQNAPNPKRTS